MPWESCFAKLGESTYVGADSPISGGCTVRASQSQALASIVRPRMVLPSLARTGPERAQDRADWHPGQKACELPTGGDRSTAPSRRTTAAVAVSVACSLLAAGRRFSRLGVCSSLPLQACFDLYGAAQSSGCAVPVSRSRPRPWYVGVKQRLPSPASGASPEHARLRRRCGCGWVRLRGCGCGWGLLGISGDERPWVGGWRDRRGGGCVRVGGVRWEGVGG